MDRKTRFQQLKMEIKHYMETLTGLKNQKAIRAIFVKLYALPKLQIELKLDSPNIYILHM